MCSQVRGRPNLLQHRSKDPINPNSKNDGDLKEGEEVRPPDASHPWQQHRQLPEERGWRLHIIRQFTSGGERFSGEKGREAICSSCPSSPSKNKVLHHDMTTREYTRLNNDNCFPSLPVLRMDAFNAETNEEAIHSIPALFRCSFVLINTSLYRIFI